MAVTMYNAAGYDGTALVEYPNQPTRGRANGSYEWSYKCWCLTTLAHDQTGGLIPPRFTSRTINGLTAYLVDVQTTETDEPGISDVVLRYNLSASVASPIYSDGDIERRSQVIMIEIPVDNDAGYDDMPEVVDEARNRGDRTVKVAGARYEYSEHKANFTWSEENVLKTIGLTLDPNRVGTPTGLLHVADPTKWIFRGKTITETPRQSDGSSGYTPAIAKISEEWEYSPIGWAFEAAPAP